MGQGLPLLAKSDQGEEYFGRMGYFEVLVVLFFGFGMFSIRFGYGREVDEVKVRFGVLVCCERGVFADM